MMVKALVVAGTIGTVLQLAMVLTGHQVRSIQDWYGPGGMALSLLAGVIYASVHDDPAWWTPLSRCP